MKFDDNPGLSQQEITALKHRVSKTANSFEWVNDDGNGEEYAHVRFVGIFEGNEAIYDAVLYTLRLQHESELFEIAEHQAAKHFPQYKKITYEEDENGNLEKLDDLEEEIGLFMAEVILELEEEGEVKVKEHVDIDPNNDFGIGLDVGLHVDQITTKLINQFISDFNKGALRLDENLYSFQTQSESTETKN